MAQHPFTHKKFLLIGFGKSGYALANVLIQCHARVIINEQKSLANDIKAAELKEKGVTIIDGSHPLSLAEQHFDCVVKNPGIPYSNPLIQAFLEKGTNVVTEIELGYLMKENSVIGITGSNGKTTTTTLIREFLIQDNKPAKTAGNIGNVFTEVLFKSEPEDIIVTELSSFQLQGTTSFRPNISVLLNLHEAHLDYHGDFAQYKNAKTKLIRNQTSSDYCVYNADDIHVQDMVRHTKAKLLPFSTKDPNAYAYCDGQTFYIANNPVVDVSDVRLKGSHNIENILAAITVAKLLGVSNSSIKETMLMFYGVEHRLQYVDTVNNRMFYNDSKSTNLFATQTAVNAFNEPIVLLMGGLDRGIDFREFAPYFQRVKAVVSFGAVNEQIIEMAKESGCPISYACKTVQEAVYKAYSLSDEGDVLLLSPGCASWDQYKSYEERGYDFIRVTKDIGSKSHQLLK